MIEDLKFFIIFKSVNILLTFYFFTIGIINPIQGGEVREKNEQYRGVGVKADPFEAFRKNKSQGYIQRLRTRDEIRKEESK